MANNQKRAAKVGAAPWAALMILGTALANPSTAQPSGEPPLVSAYLEQLAQACGGAAAGRLSPDRVDLNRDGVDDWVVDAARRPCVKPVAGLARQGDLLTVFVSLKDGRTVPAFQAVTHGSRLERLSGVTTLWVSVSGADCGEPDPAARCDRRLAWRPEAFRFVLEAAGPKATR
ncbi:hypothetical protein M9M90_00865 [Phenylobacterium sp. LH3H17]|uniref:hypothetical protein n=1 Tax=Phenylobacterium sp. LH3H17 TaxID=2903901 RepID=UPI0020C95E21|nr:hypothetical protein [Phenylobacterium sp. LH3H17]UTP39761.1 hypothetical protein M9M90_00865 [Phenylobacterium sp. LH3H17]